MKTTTLKQTQLQELQFYKKLVENNLQEDLSAAEIKQLEQAKKHPSSQKKNF